jgi:hypothetical protein
VIRIERVTLPSGLRAVARRDENGHLIIYVSAELDSRQQRAAVLEAVRASRRAGWRAALPIWIGLAAGLRFWLRRLQSLIRAQPAGWATGTGAVVAAGVIAGVLLASPGSHNPLASGGAPGGVSTSQAAQGQSGGGSHGRRHVQPIVSYPSGSASGGPQPGSSSPRPGHSSPAPGRSHSSAPTSSSPPPRHSSSPSPTPSTGSSTPTPTHTPTPTPTPKTSSPKPTPTPSPKPSKTKHCVTILGITICLGL